MKHTGWKRAGWIGASALVGLIFASASLAGGSIHQHLTMDLLPLAQSPMNKGGLGLGLSYDRIHDELKSAYSIGVETQVPFTGNPEADVLVTLGFVTEVTRAFSVGARMGMSVTDPRGAVGFGALVLRLPALFPEDKRFMGFYFEEIDLGMFGAGERYACLRLGMLLW